VNDSILLLVNAPLGRSSLFSHRVFPSNGKIFILDYPSQNKQKKNMSFHAQSQRVSWYKSNLRFPATKKVRGRAWFLFFASILQHTDTRSRSSTKHVLTTNNQLNEPAWGLRKHRFHLRDAVVH